MDNTRRPNPSHENTIINTRAGRNLTDPLDYRHPYDSMRRYPKFVSR